MVPLVAFALVTAPAAVHPQASPPSGQAPAAQHPSFPSGTEIVTVDVVVTGRNGRPVLDLRQEDFTVSEDGKAQEITSFEAVHHEPPAPPVPGAQPKAPEPRTSSNLVVPGLEPASFVILFDELHLAPAEAVRARGAVTRFLQEETSAGDRVALVGTFEGTRYTARMPEGREALLQVLGRLQGRHVGEPMRDFMTDFEAMRIDQDRDPIVTDQVMRRLISTGQILHDVDIPGQPADNDTTSFREQTQSLAVQAYARARVRLEQTLGILERSLQALAEARGRKSLVLVSAGLIEDGRLAGFRRAVSEARRANVAIYSLDARGLVAAAGGLSAEVSQPLELVDRSTGVGLTETLDASAGSEGLALDTGGFVLKNRNDLGAALARVARESRSYYLVGYTPANRAADGRFRKIAVKVARQGVEVRARRGYYAPGPSQAAKPEGRDAAIQRALDAPFDLPGVPLRGIAQAFGEAQPGKTSVRVTVEADIRGFAFADKGGAATDTLEYLLLVVERASGESTRFDQQFEMAFKPETRARFERSWFPITRELPLAPGPYQARVVARDKNSGRVGSLSHDFEVPAPAGLRVSSLVVSDRLRDDPTSQGRVPELVAQRAFAAAGVLNCRFEVYGAARAPAGGPPNVTAGFAIRRSDGRVLVAAPETAMRPGPDGSLARSFGVPLDGAPPGLYEVIVQVTDLSAGQIAETREPIRIEGSPAR